MAGAIVVTGGALAIGGQTLPHVADGSSIYNALMTSGGLLVSTISAFPVKDVLLRREKLDVIRLLKERLKAAHGRSDGGAESEKIAATVWKIVDTVVQR